MAEKRVKVQTRWASPMSLRSPRPTRPRDGRIYDLRMARPLLSAILFQLLRTYRPCPPCLGASAGGFSARSPISVVDLTTYTVTGTIDAGSIHIVFSPTAPVAYTWNGNLSSGTLYAINRQTYTVTSTMPLVTGGLYISPDGKYLYSAGTLPPWPKCQRSAR